jgi:hypothetical protein
MCRNITVIVLSASTLTFSTAPGAQANTSAKVCRPGLGEDVAVSPDILLHNEGAARQYKAHLLHRLSGAKQAGAFGKGVDPCPEAGEHGGKLVVGNTGEKRRGVERLEKFFHKKFSFVENSTDLLLLV